MRNFIMIVLLGTLFTQSKAQVYDYTDLQGAGDDFPYAQFRIYVPDTISSIRGIYCLVEGTGGDSRPIVDDTTFRKLCDEMGFALLGVRLMHSGDPYQPIWGGLGIFKSVVRAFNSFAIQSSHAEIEYAPIFFEGYSWGGIFSYNFTWWKPEKVIGFIPVAFYADTILVGPATQVPGYLVYGEFDAPEFNPTLGFEKNRSKGALWSLAMQPNVAHNPIIDRDLLDNYFKDVIELRLPKTIIPGHPVALNTIDESIGWFGDRSTFEIAQYDSFPGDKLQACWFPSEEVALRWQNFVSPGNTGKIRESNLSNKKRINLIPQRLIPDLYDSNPFNYKIIKVGKSNVQHYPEIPLSEANASFIGKSATENSGYCITSAGDVNGDGFDDFLIGAYGKDGSGLSKTNIGITYLILGSAAVNWGMDFNLSQADASFVGETGGDRSGCSVALAGDVNGDGLDDFLIGARQNKDGGNYSGKTYLILGRALADWGSEFNLSHADASFVGKAPYDWSGAHISSAGDVNGDGLDDILIGADGEDGDAGKIDIGATYLILGRAAADWSTNYSLSHADASFIGEASGDRSGFSIASAGDVNGDGLDDFLIGTLFNFNNEGKNDSQTYLILGRVAADWGMNNNLSKADASFVGETRFDFSGHSVTSAGDVNGDGLDDFLIGAHDNCEAGYFSGQVYLLLGKAAADWGMDFNLSQADASFIGEAAFDVSGFSVASAGDINADGLDDFLIGAPNNNASGKFAGKTYLLLGKTDADWGMDFNLSEADISYIGEVVQNLSGYSVASAGDINGDGFDDIIIGGWRNNEGALEGGQTYLLLGKETPTSIVEEKSIPFEFALSQNYPNPFNPTTTIGFGIMERGNVRMSVLNILGEEIRVLLNEEKEAGYHSIDFNASDLPSGVYFYRIQSGNFIETKKMLLLR